MTTFNKRGTPPEDIPLIFSTEFKTNRDKQEQWSVFVKRNRLESTDSFIESLDKLERFIEPVFKAPENKNLQWNPVKFEWGK